MAPITSRPSQPVAPTSTQPEKAVDGWASGPRSPTPPPPNRAL